MATYESIKYKFSGTAVTGVLQESENLDDWGINLPNFWD